jgi:hypothetical protein
MITREKTSIDSFPVEPATAHVVAIAIYTQNNETYTEKIEEKRQ